MGRVTVQTASSGTEVANTGDQSAITEEPAQQPPPAQSAASLESAPPAESDQTGTEAPENEASTPESAAEALPAAETDVSTSTDEVSHPEPAVETAPGLAASGTNEVVLQPYDVIRMRFLYWPELDDEQWIRPDGKISLMMIGDVEAQGLTPSQLRQQLLKLYETKLNEPDINVTVTELAGNRVYVGGEVMTPGLIFLSSKLTVLEAIFQAGGFNEYTANKTDVVIVRQLNGKQLARTIDLRAVLQDPTSEQFCLQPYDVVYVPRTKIARVNQFVEQYLDNVLPRRIGSVNFSFSKQVDQNSSKAGNSYPVFSLPSTTTGK